MQPAPTPSPDPLLETQIFWDKYKMPLAVGILAVLLLLSIIGGYRLYIDHLNKSAAALLARAQSTADYEKVIATYPSSAAAPSARLLLADAQRAKQQFGEANVTLQGFIANNPKHELISTAKMAMAANLESLGKPDEALEFYRRVSADYPRSYNAPLAMMAQIPILKHKGQIDEARKVAETVMTQYRESYVANEAANYLRTLKPSATPAPAAPAPAEQTSPTDPSAPAATVSPATAAASPAATSPGAVTTPTP